MTDKIKVVLTNHEMFLAAMSAFTRQIYAMNKGYKPHWGSMDRGWINNLNGAFGESAVAKHLDIFWSGTTGEIDKPDVGPFEVRFNQYGDFLRVPDKGKPDRQYIATTGEAPNIIIQGWAWGRDCMREEYETPPPKAPRDGKCFWFPVSKLLPMRVIYGQET